MDGWTKSKNSRTPTPEPVSSSDPKSAEDEAMDTSDPLDDPMELDVALEDLPEMVDVMDQFEAQFVLVEPDDEV